MSAREGEPKPMEQAEEATLSAEELAKAETARTALDTLLVEARTHLDVRPPQGAASDRLGEIDWSRLESRLMAVIEEEKPALVRDIHAGKNTRGARFLRVGAVALAAAAAMALFVRRDRDVALTEPTPTANVNVNERASASALRTTEGSGEVRIGGVVATPGYVAHAGDTIDVLGSTGGATATRGVFERPRKVTWLIEQNGQEATHAQVKSASDALVLGLDHGAIEAQVVPVPSGEAFAIDIATEKTLVRVAVHGTHLRVARSGNRVVVDLTEGVVAIGVPPRSGVTLGTTVTAPAHVELDATDLSTLRVDHTPSAVRPAIPLGPSTTAEIAHPDAVPAPAMPAQNVAPAPVANMKAPTTHEVTASATKVDPPKDPVPAREAIAAGVRDCATARNRSGEVHVTVSSSLRLNVSPGGVVESAQFSPPLSPDIQTCAAQVIYKVKLEETGQVTIPIEFSY